MSTGLDRAVSGALIIASLTVAGGVAYQTFTPRAASSSANISEKPQYQEDWRSSLASGQTIHGNSEAKIAIQVFTDLECPACRGFHPKLLALATKREKDVRLVYMPFPLAIHRFALGAARAAECIRTSSPDRLPQWVTLMYESQDSLGLKSWGRLANDLHLPDTALIAKCAHEPGSFPNIDSTLAYADRHAINGTPTLMVNGWLYRGLPTITDIESLIDQLLKQGRTQ
jgi:protein-disulfide isomerase